MSTADLNAEGEAIALRRELEDITYENELNKVKSLASIYLICIVLWTYVLVTSATELALYDPLKGFCKQWEPKSPDDKRHDISLKILWVVLTSLLIVRYMVGLWFDYKVPMRNLAKERAEVLRRRDEV